MVVRDQPTAVKICNVIRGCCFGSGKGQGCGIRCTQMFGVFATVDQPTSPFNKDRDA